MQTRITVGKSFFFANKSTVIELVYPLGTVYKHHDVASSQSWTSIQVDKDLFQVSARTQASRLLHNNEVMPGAGLCGFSVVKKAQMYE